MSVEITITETVVYRKKYTRDELSAVLSPQWGDTGGMTEQELAGIAAGVWLNADVEADMQKHGSVDDSRWEARVI
jgi:hypothetical protein